MRRTTIFLPDDLHDRLRQEAFAARTSMAHLIRTKLEARKPRNRARAKDPLTAVEGLVRDGHLAEGIDEALYSS